MQNNPFLAKQPGVLPTFLVFTQYKIITMLMSIETQ